MATTRKLDEQTLNNAARDMAGAFLLPTIYSQNDPSIALWGREWVIQTFQNAHYKDEVKHLIARVRKYLGSEAVAELDALLNEKYVEQHDDEFEANLATRLAIRPDGTKIAGQIGKVIIGQIPIVSADGSWKTREKVIKGKRGRKLIINKIVYQPVYAGQEELLNGGINALNMNISAEIALLGLNALLDGLDEGTGAAVIQGRTGAQPVDPDAATTGTNLFTLVMTDPAFANATDQGNGTVRASASAITSDSSADATGTVGYCRVSATNDGATPLDDHIDGEAGTSGADFNFNTVSIVSGATVSMTSYTVTLDQGTTAT